MIAEKMDIGNAEEEEEDDYYYYSSDASSGDELELSNAKDVNDNGEHNTIVNAFSNGEEQHGDNQEFQNGMVLEHIDGVDGENGANSTNTERAASH